MAHSGKNSMIYALFVSVTDCSLHNYTALKASHNHRYEMAIRIASFLDLILSLNVPLLCPFLSLDGEGCKKTAPAQDEISFSARECRGGVVRNDIGCDDYSVSARASIVLPRKYLIVSLLF